MLVLFGSFQYLGKSKHQAGSTEESEPWLALQKPGNVPGVL